VHVTLYQRCTLYIMPFWWRSPVDTFYVQLQVCLPIPVTSTIKGQEQAEIFAVEVNGTCRPLYRPIYSLHIMDATCVAVIRMQAACAVRCCQFLLAYIIESASCTGGPGPATGTFAVVVYGRHRITTCWSTSKWNMMKSLMSASWTKWSAVIAIHPCRRRHQHSIRTSRYDGYAPPPEIPRSATEEIKHRQKLSRRRWRDETIHSHALFLGLYTFNYTPL